VSTQDAEDLLSLVLSGSVQEDPYEVLDRLRDTAPIYFSDQFKGWFLTRYDDCSELLRSADFHQALGDHLAKADPRYESSAFLQNVANLLSFMNPPQHTRCRRLVARAFTPRIVEASRPHIEQLVAEALAELEDEEEFDVHEMISRRIPGNVICQMMGIPVEDRDMLLGWSDKISHAVQPVIPDDALREADEVVEAFDEYILALAERRRSDPGPDLVSELIAAEADAGKLSHAEFVGVTHTMISAGIETAQGMLSSGVLAFLQTPGEVDKIRADPSLAGAAADEALRLQAPVQVAFQRVALQDSSIADQEIKKGEVVNGMLGAANHDPAAFPPDPHRFRIDRPRERPHLAFGNGIHFCVGAALARVEGEITFRRLFEAMPDLELVDETPQWRARYVIRSPERLRVRRGDG
jgi:cytochrome P450